VPSPGDVLDAFGMEAQHPDVFAENLFDLDQACVVVRLSLVYR
jgi:hypothetical protein